MVILIKLESEKQYKIEKTIGFCLTENKATQSHYRNHYPHLDFSILELLMNNQIISCLVMPKQLQTIKVNSLSAQIRLDKYIAERYPERSRNFWQQLIRDGKILVNGAKVKPNYQLKPGDFITVELPPPESDTPAPEPIALNIIYEDEHIIVVNKPPGLVVHPAAGNKEHTLVNAILHHCPEIEFSGHRQRPGIVHRLDKDTSGVMVVAKTHKAYLNLVQQISERRVRRRYKTLVLGIPDPPEQTIELPIGRHPRHRTKMAVNLINGKPAITHFKTIERFQGLSLLEVSLHTGRTHQIRVHLAHIGHPVVGDSQYGLHPSVLIARLPVGFPEKAKETILNTKRQMLHSFELLLTHPATGKEMCFKAELPPDFAHLISILCQQCHSG